MAQGGKRFIGPPCGGRNGNNGGIVMDSEVLADDPERSLRGVYLGADATNPTLILRVRSLLRAGVDLTAFTFRRHKFNTDFQPEWTNVHLGDTVDRNYIRRLPTLLRGLWRIVAHADVIRDADFIYARNFDLTLLAIAARTATSSPAKIIYEVEDVQEVFFKSTLAGAVFRRLERWVLGRIDLLVPLSPGFLRGYFEPIQGYRGPSFVLENKLQLQGRSDEPSEAVRVWETIADRWVIGWFGTLRCPKSMALLEEIAVALGPRVEIYTRGYPTETGLDAYMRIVARHPNWVYEGEYNIPDDLEEMYGRVHFSWCLDFLDELGNSPLLLACRMYQGGFFGAVPLVAADSEMHRWLAAAGLGHAFRPPYAGPIIDFLRDVDPADYRAQRESIMERRRELFFEDGSDIAALLQRIRALRSIPRQSAM